MKKKKLKYFLIIFICLCVGFVIAGMYNGLCLKEYDVDTQKMDKQVRIALITDLHSCSYDNELIQMVNEQNPDIVMLVGDIFDDILSDENTISFLDGIANKYPCYYVTGNHEYWSGSSAFEEKMNVLTQHGVVWLSAEMDIVTVNGESINICGVDDPDSTMIASTNKYQDTLSFDEQIEKVRSFANNGNYTILLSHRPEYIDKYVVAGFDLVLCGHAHGGQWRIPGLINGLYAPDQGWFPKYAGGLYIKENTTMIVSRGLAKESTRIPRFYNRPEVVIINIH